MYEITFPPQSNRADFIFVGGIYDAQTGEALDLTDYTLTFEVTDANGCQKLKTSTADDDGKLTVVDVGIWRLRFSKDEMGALCPGTYQTGMTIENEDGQTRQLSIGPLSIYEGVVR